MANAVIGALRVNLGIDSAQFQNGLKNAQSSADRFAKVLKTTMVAAAGAAAAALGALSIAVRGAVASANDLGDVADRLGVNIERLQELRYAADRGGMSVQNFDVAFRRFIRRAAEAAKGTGAAKDAFTELGVELRDANGQLRPSEELLHDVADAMQGVQSPADKLRLAFKMFDTDGAAMVNVLANGSQGMKELADEAQRLGLVLSEDTVRVSQTITDNFEMAGNVITGMVNRLTAFLAPALVVVSEAVVAVALKFHDLIEILPTVAEYAAVAGGSLAVMLAPSIIAAAGNLAVAIGTHLVGAVRLLTAAIAANPLGALAVGITIAVTAIYHFRDEIQKAIGVDVVQVVKDAANFIINSFVAAYEDIRLAWAQMPAAIGDVVIRAANYVISTVEGMVNKSVQLINGFLQSLPFGIGEGLSLGEFDLGRITNQFEGAAADYAAARRSMIEEVFAVDRIGQIASAFQGATPSVQDFSGALADANAELDDMAGSSGEGKGKGGGGKLGTVKDNLKSAADEMSQFVDSVASAMSNAFQSLVDGSKSVKDVLRDLLKQLSSMLLNDAFKALVGGIFGGRGAGGIFGGLGKILGFARGGTILPGGAGGIDSQLVVFRKSPNERVDITKPGQSLSSGETYAPVYNIDARGADQAAITRLERALAERDRNFGRMVDQRNDTRQTRGTRG